MSKNPSDMVVVAGGTGRIGSAVCRCLRLRGMPVLAVGRRPVPERLAEGVIYFPCDLLKLGAPRRIEARVAECGFRLRGLVVTLSRSMTGSLCLRGLNSEVRLVEDLRSGLAASGQGSVVMLSSTAARLAFRTGEARFYAGLNGYIESYVHTAAGEFGPHVRINAVAPGIVAEEAGGGTVHRKISRDAIPAGRFGGADEIASFIVQVLLDNKYVNGQTLTIDGGMTSSLAI